MTHTPEQIAAQISHQTTYTLERGLEPANAVNGVSAEQLAGLLAYFGRDADAARLIVEAQAFRSDLTTPPHATMTQQTDTEEPIACIPVLRALTEEEVREIKAGEGGPVDELTFHELLPMALADLERDYEEREDHATRFIFGEAELHIKQAIEILGRLKPGTPGA